MITFDILTLKAFIEEQKDFFEGARINKIQQPTRREFLFTMRNNRETRQFYVNINPQFYHCCFVTKESLEKRVLEIPQKPPMFCMQLRKYLENSRISKVVQPINERILEIYIETYNELGENIYLCLAFEFMGRHSNVVLYNYDTNMIIGCAHNVGAGKSREREIYGGLPYVYPPKQRKSNLLDYNGSINYETLSDDFFMFSSAFAKQCYGIELDKLKSYLRLENLTPCISSDYSNYSLYSELLDKSFRVENVNNMIDEYYSHYISLDKFKTLKQTYRSIILQKIKKVSKSLKQMEYRNLTASESDKYRLWGDLLMANLYNLQNYTDVASVYDYENNLQISINLDKTKPIKDNANNFYKLYNKAKVTLNKLTLLIQDSKDKKMYLEQILYSIDNAQNINDLHEISSEVLEKAETKQTDKKKKMDITFIEKENETRIYVGKNNKQNDYIISKIASDEDLWFHVHNNAGSHILLKTQKVTDELIYECAKLAKEYSVAKASAKVGVIYTKRKYLRKPPKANLGYVTYRNESEIIV